jgi:hypothetical protein
MSLVTGPDFYALSDGAFHFSSRAKELVHDTGFPVVNLDQPWSGSWVELVQTNLPGTMTVGPIGVHSRHLVNCCGLDRSGSTTWPAFTECGVLKEGPWRTVGTSLRA